MSNDLTPSNLLNPMMLWADMGLRALEMSVSSSQKLGDSLDRVARAGASAEVPEATVSSPAAHEGAASAPASGLALARQMQRSTFDLMTQNWLQWMSSFATVASLAAGSGRTTASDRKVALDALHWGLQPAGTETPSAQTQPGGSSRQQSGRSREGRAETGSKDHALASAEPQRRRSTTRAKRKPRSRNV